MLSRSLARSFSAIALCLLVASPSFAQAPPSYDFDFATIGSPNNPAYTTGPTNPNGDHFPLGRGSVSYTYRISRLEITTAQWMEFANTAGALGDPFRIGEEPSAGYERDVSAPGTFHYRLRDFPGAAMAPVHGISWLNAARYCNWLNNGKAATLDALVTGAYDTTTFGEDPNTGHRTDALTHLPGAKFWIPTSDEWVKAVHFDPNRYASGAGGWWQYPNSSDQPLISGPAGGGGQTNAGYSSPGDIRSLLLGAYPDVQTPWGLLDASGGSSEWMEDVDNPETRRFRYFDGSSEFSNRSFNLALDQTWTRAADFPDTWGEEIGLRIASVVPAPSNVLVITITFAFATRKRATNPGGRTGAPAY